MKTLFGGSVLTFLSYFRVSNGTRKASLDYPDHAKSNTWYRQKCQTPSTPKSEPNRGSQKRYFTVSFFYCFDQFESIFIISEQILMKILFLQNATKGSQSFSQDLLSRSHQSKSPLYFTALESPSPVKQNTNPPIRYVHFLHQRYTWSNK